MIRHFQDTTAFTQGVAPDASPYGGAGGHAHGTAPLAGAEPLACRLDFLIGALPVERLELDPTLLRAMRRLDPRRRLVLRRIRIAHGASVDLIALPYGFENDPARLAALRNLRSRRQRLGLPLRIIREAVVDREPRLSNARLIHESAGFHPSRPATERLLRHLFIAGGCDSLRSCLVPLRGEVDPACAVLALVGSNRLAVDLDQPLGPASPVRRLPNRVTQG